MDALVDPTTACLYLHCSELFSFLFFEIWFTDVLQMIFHHNFPSFQQIWLYYICNFFKYEGNPHSKILPTKRWSALQDFKFAVALHRCNWISWAWSKPERGPDFNNCSPQTIWDFGILRLQKGPHWGSVYHPSSKITTSRIIKIHAWRA